MSNSLLVSSANLSQFGRRIFTFIKIKKSAILFFFSLSKLRLWQFIKPHRDEVYCCSLCRSWQIFSILRLYCEVRICLQCPMNIPLSNIDTMLTRISPLLQHFSKTCDHSEAQKLTDVYVLPCHQSTKRTS